MTQRPAPIVTLLLINATNSLAAGALTASTWILAGEKVRFRILASVILLCFLCYGVLRPPHPKSRKGALYLFLVVMGYFAMDMYRIQPRSWSSQPGSMIYLLFAISGLLTVLYHPRGFISQWKFRGLRSIPWVKNLIIGITWGTLTSVPILFSVHQWEVSAAMLLIAARSIYIAGLSLLSDLGDRQSDSPHLRTGSIWLGVSATKITAVCCASIADVLLWYAGWTFGIFTLPTIAVVFILNPQAKWRNELAIDASAFCTLLLTYLLA